VVPADAVPRLADIDIAGDPCVLPVVTLGQVVCDAANIVATPRIMSSMGVFFGPSGTYAH
jgi:hypothetical protein